jgi:peptide/nickel transport system substrate-binding protein
MFTYNPTKAKQMLSDAGYPNGFSATIVADGTGGTYLDQLAIIKSMWSKIGVDLTIKPMEFAAYTSTVGARAYDDMMYGGSGSHGIYIRGINWDGGTQFNGSYINDPTAHKAAVDMATAMASGDQAKADQVYTTFEKYAIDQSWMVPFPQYYNYTMWWSWLKNYRGELNVGFDNGATWSRFVWLDQDLKKSMLAQ